jgi:hypothetical protein
LVASQAQMIERLTAQVEVLTARVAELERQLGRNSGNSSMPPSTDDLPGRTPPADKAELGKGPKRKQGKQRGAPGANLAWSENPNRLRRAKPPSEQRWPVSRMSGYAGGPAGHRQGRRADGVRQDRGLHRLGRMDVAPGLARVDEEAMSRSAIPAGSANALTWWTRRPACQCPTSARARVWLRQDQTSQTAAMTSVRPGLIHPPPFRLQVVANGGRVSALVGGAWASGLTNGH